MQKYDSEPRTAIRRRFRQVEVETLMLLVLAHKAGGGDGGPPGATAIGVI